MISQIKLVVLFILFAFFISFAQEETKTGTIIINVNNIEHDNGVIRAALHSTDSRESFPSPGPNGLAQWAVTDIKNQQVSITFDNVQYGDYALAVYHDENANDKLDANFIGMPKEGYGFSNNPKARFGPPKFNDAQFAVEADTLKLDIYLKY